MVFSYLPWISYEVVETLGEGSFGVVTKNKAPTNLQELLQSTQIRCYQEDQGCQWPRGSKWGECSERTETWKYCPVPWTFSRCQQEWSLHRHGILQQRNTDWLHQKQCFPCSWVECLENHRATLQWTRIPSQTAPMSNVCFAWVCPSFLFNIVIGFCGWYNFPYKGTREHLYPGALCVASVASRELGSQLSVAASVHHHHHTTTCCCIETCVCVQCSLLPISWPAVVTRTPATIS